MTNNEKIERIKNRYPKGTQIELTSMKGEPQMPVGLKGVVDMVDDIGQIHVDWENGSSLALNVDEDSFRIIQQEQDAAPEENNGMELNM